MTRILFFLTLIFFFTGEMFLANSTGEEVNAEYTEHLNQGAAYYGKSQYDKAIEEYTQAIKLQQDSSEAYNNRGNAYFAKSQYDLAISDYSKAIEIDPKYAEAYNNRGRVYLLRGQYDLAIFDTSEAIELAPEYEDPYLIQALACDETGRVSDAIEAYKKLIQYASPKNKSVIDDAIKRLAELEDFGPITSEELFTRKFSEAVSAKDYEKMRKLVKRAEPIMFNMLLESEYEGIIGVAAGKEETGFFDAVEMVAKLYAEMTGKEGPLIIVRLYKQYTRQMCEEKIKGDKLLEDSNSFYSEGKLDDALKLAENALNIFTSIDDRVGKARALKKIGDVLSDFGQYNQSLAYYNESLVLSRGMNNFTDEAWALLCIGVVHGHQSSYESALNYFKQAYEIFLRIRDLRGEVSVWGNMAAVYMGTGRYNEALSYSKQVLKVGLKIKEYAEVLAAFNNIGIIYYKLGQYSDSLIYHQKAFEANHAIGRIAGEALSLNNIGLVKYTLVEYDDALNYFLKALEIFKKVNQPEGEVSALQNIGNIYKDIGQYNDAMYYFKQVVDKSRKLGFLDIEAGGLGSIGQLYLKIGQFNEALKYLYDSLAISRKTGNVEIESADLSSIGDILNKFGQYTDALQMYNDALSIDRKTGRIAFKANSLISIGTIHYQLRQYTEALNFFNSALDIYKKVGSPLGECSALSNIGLIYSDYGQYHKAITFQQEAIKISEKLNYPEGHWRVCRALAISIFGSGRPEEAVAQYQKSIDTIEKLYSQTAGLKEEERSSMIGEKFFVYQEFIDLLLELHRKSPNKGYDKQAFVISEKAKSRTFQELMAKAGAKIAFAEEAKDETFRKMIGKEQQLIAEAANYRTLLTKELSKPEKQRSAEVVESLREQLSKVEKSLTDHQKTIDEKYPRYADLKRPKALTVKDLQDTLKPGETVVSYAVGKDKTAVFVIGKRSFKLIELGTGKKELVELVKSFREGLDNVTEVTDLEKFEPEVAYKLYQKVFQPMAGDLKEVKKLYISADDVLYTLPFEALVDREVDTKAFDDAKLKGGKGKGAYLGEYSTLHYLVDTYTITYLPSASVLRSLRKFEKPGYGKWGKSLIAFADPVFSPEETTTEEERKGVKSKGIQQKGITDETRLAMQIFTRSAGETKLGRLKESSEEATAIVKEVKGKKEDLYMREKATEDNVYKANLKDAHYILFSTHGLLGGDFSGVAEPSLALTLINNPSGRDGFLTMSEVLRLDLNAEMVILSACNTSGKGDKVGSGEGFAGLTRSFMYAGTRSILVTHWSVESQAARDLMVDTFGGMKQEAKPDALRDAKLKMKSSTRKIGKENLSLSHPFYWAPFVMVGER